VDAFYQHERVYYVFAKSEHKCSQNPSTAAQRRTPVCRTRCHGLSMTARSPAGKVSKVRHLLGWEPRVPLEEGLRFTLDYSRPT
jgi:predicted dithiol-disulfide oxidoreductase (DUF899 family)